MKLVMYTGIHHRNTNTLQEYQRYKGCTKEEQELNLVECQHLVVENQTEHCQVKQKNIIQTDKIEGLNSRFKEGNEVYKVSHQTKPYHTFGT